MPLILLGSTATSAAIFECVDAGGAVTCSRMTCPGRNLAEPAIEPPVRRSPPPSDRSEAPAATEPGRTAAARPADRSGGRAAVRGRDGRGSPE